MTAAESQTPRTDGVAEALETCCTPLLAYDEMKSFARQLERELSSRPTAGWVAVEERLPPSWERVVVAFIDGNKLPDLFLFRGDADEAWAKKWRVTHWMPLPEPPDAET